MRLRSVWISDYKNLKDFSISFEGDGFIDIFVGKNGSGKSNFLEALIEIFDHIYSEQAGNSGPTFDYELIYETDRRDVSLAWREGDFTVDGRSKRQSLGQTPAPDHLLVYYSGQNHQVASLVKQYEEKFRDNLRRATGPVAPKIIGIGPSCKKLLIVTMLILSDGCVARQILCQKLGILGCRRSIELTLSKPFFVKREDHDPFDADQLFWGVTGYIRTFLQNLLESIEGEFTPGQLYDREAGSYRLTCNIDQLREVLDDESGLTLFQSLEALRVLGMLSDIRLPLTLQGFEISGLDLFSDGQFQSVYLFGIAELFKELNCIALLDEPDAFLHPEWQFEFLKQVNSISEEAAQTNHFLLTSHSASTIAASSDSRIRIFSSVETGIAVADQSKGDLVQSLSAGLITFSEQEATLSINNILRNSNGPVLFTEGVTDALILRCAWNKLNHNMPCPVAIEQGYGRGFLRNLFTKMDIYDSNPIRTYFALFDFDEAYADWVQFGEDVETDAYRCLGKQWNGQQGFGLLLPVPVESSIKDQVLRGDNGGNYNDRSRLSMELMFRDVPELSCHFVTDPCERDNCIKFVGDKVKFAEKTVPNLDAQYFEVFRPIFDFINNRC